MIYNIRCIKFSYTELKSAKSVLRRISILLSTYYNMIGTKVVYKHIIYISTNSYICAPFYSSPFAFSKCLVLNKHKTKKDNLASQAIKLSTTLEYISVL